MPTNFPSSVDSFVTAAEVASVALGGVFSHPTEHENLGDAIVAIETYLLGGGGGGSSDYDDALAWMGVYS